MQAWKHIGRKKISLITLPYSKIEDKEKAKVRIERALAAYSDFEIFDSLPQKENLTLGRYAVGAISERAEDAVDGLDKGARVVISSWLPCGECPCCKAGKEENCSQVKRLGVDVNGVFSDFIDLPVSALHRLPEAVSYEEALFVQHISLALNALDAINVEKGEHVAVFSDTNLGLVLCQLALHYGAIPILIQNDEEVLKCAKTMGIFYAFSYKTRGELEKKALTVTGGRMCEKAVYVKNSDYPIKHIFNICSHRADVVFLLGDGKSPLINVNDMVEKEITLKGINNGLGNFPAAINLLATKVVNTDCLKGQKIPFSQLGQTLEGLTAQQIKTKNIIVNVE